MVVEQERTTHTAGGASNVAANAVALGASACIAGVIGSDEMGIRLTDCLVRLGADTTGLVADPARPTTRKTRIIAHGQQVVRVDHEDRSPISPATADALLLAALDAANEVDAVLFSDYNKGTLSAELVAMTTAAVRARGGVTVANPKPQNISLFQGLDLVSLNQAEAEAVAGQPIVEGDTLQDVGCRLLALVGCDGVFVTRGGNGIDVFESDGSHLHVSGITQEVYDVAGAGDSVVATAALALAAGATCAEAAVLANYAGNAKVRKLGVVPVTRDDIRAIWRLAEGPASDSP
jgi:D-beta-D-heptose 7-phosphate kinase/D-beta-D-heptose 1-phosphate adenosyltransferase